MLSSREHFGRFDRRITIQSPVTDKDAYGQEEITEWEDVATVWASVDDSAGSERYLADQETATRTTTFKIRYRGDVNEKMRILFDFRYYDIESIQRPDRDRTLIIRAAVLDDPIEVDHDGEGIFDATFDVSFE